ncbi:fumarylacetoacetate hydrolase family protein [Noviherbaspirillum sp. Root189]|uniref:fumarylacetoacetate hydrolase family protein n=1 Tax=Noviherbaspirillum sp. Root189 TaxID=1736487 RepID=UPI0007098A07|nr:fumarylacetoacetate hydrolase family protein [Noviherbaspirillum sp. Root189]KRB93535.1 hypothetical protein ASE07_12605 [Noviherbaspirillum sp. Root189]
MSNPPRNQSIFKLGRFSIAGCTPFTGLVFNDESVVALRALTSIAAVSAEARAAFRGDESMRDLLESWPHYLDALRKAIAGEGAAEAIKRSAVPLSALQIHAPVMPRQIFCTIANYHSGAIEAVLDKAAKTNDPASAKSVASAVLDACQHRVRHGEPYVASKLSSAVIGPYDPIPIPASALQVDWEVELGVVIGTGGYAIRREDAMRHVAAYTVVNDITARDLIARSDVPAMGTDWLKAKSGPGFLPVGPFLVPACEINDPYTLHMSLRLNGTTMQQECCRDMMFDIAAQIAHVSRHARLFPGDLICTGSPAGFGSHFGRFLRVGDVVEATVAGIGAQRNACIDTDIT